MVFNRTLISRLVRRASSRLGRLLVLTGARQTGKTTLIRHAFPEFQYLSLEDPTIRPSFSRLSAQDWIARYPRAIADEVQKAPTVIEAIKAAYDASPDVRYLLLGSSQILLLSRVRETLAGRVAIEELWPLTLPELATTAWDDPVRESPLLDWLADGAAGGDALLQAVWSSPAAGAAVGFESYVRFGGMPVVADSSLTDEERYEWLRDYQRTYLERDVADLAALRDLEPFVLAQKAIAARSGRAVNWSDLARAAGVAPATALRFSRYLELSYQVFVLRPYFRNEEKRLAKMPKIHFVDPGILRTVLGRRGEPSGEEFESAVVSEVIKQIRNAALPIAFWWLRTHDGREVDLLLELEGGFVAIEVKESHAVRPVDARHLRGLGAFLDKPFLQGVVLSQDRDARRLTEESVALPIVRALGPGPGKATGG